MEQRKPQLEMGGHPLDAAAGTARGGSRMTAAVLIVMTFVLAYVCIDLEHIEQQLRDIVLELAARRKEEKHE